MQPDAQLATLVMFKVNQLHKPTTIGKDQHRENDCTPPS